MKLGILQCDSVRPELIDEFGDYPAMFKRLLSRVDPTISFACYNLVENAFPASLDECDAWLFTGSKYGANDTADWISRAEELVRALQRQQCPTIGICFGHQLIARALGGRVERAAGWGVGVHTANILEHSAWMQPPKSTLSLLVSHQDQVVELPPAAVRLAGHDFCRNDIYRIGQHILTFQGHPEFAKGYSLATMTQRRERIGAAVFDAGCQSLQRSVDGAIAASWIVRFLQAATAS